MEVNHRISVKLPVFKLLKNNEEKPKAKLPDNSNASTNIGSAKQNSGPNNYVTAEVSNYYKCHVEGCSRCFNYLYQLRKHTEYVHKLQFYECLRCGSKFAKYSNYRKHTRNIFTCEKSKSLKSDQVDGELLTEGLLLAKILIEQFARDEITHYDETLLFQRCPGMISFNSLLP